MEERDASKAPQLTIACSLTAGSRRPPRRSRCAVQPSALDKASGDVEAAERALQEAKADLERGREPQEGERLGLKGGGSRLSPAYEERVRQLEQRVTLAEERLRAAYAARNAAR